MRGSPSQKTQSRRARRLLLPILAATFISACRPARNPEAALEHAQRAFERGDIAAAASESEEGYDTFRSSGSDWAWRFLLLRTRVLQWQGMNTKVLDLLRSEPSVPSSTPLKIARLRIEAVADASSHRFPEADSAVAEAENLCASFPDVICIDVKSARAKIEMERGHFEQGRDLYKQVLAAARAGGGPFRVAGALLNLSWVADEQTHFDEALDWATAARGVSVDHGFADIAQTALGNIGWAYYKLGDEDKGEQLLIEASQEAEKLHDVTDQLRWLTDVGYIQAGADNSQAERSFRKALELASGISSREETINSLIALAFISEQTGKLGDAKRYADEALAMAKADGNGRDIVYPLLVEGRVAAQEHDAATAEANFREVAKSSDTPVFLKWEAERSLARLYEDENHSEMADREYRTALTTFEAARCGLHERVDSRLPFLSNAARIYEDYIHFLVIHGRVNDGLRVADYARARTLAEGLGRPCKAKFSPDLLNAIEIARRARGTILFYGLGREHSYVWAITPQLVRMFPLAANQTEIDSAVERYRKKLEGPREVLEAATDGSLLYQMLIAPAEGLIKQEASRGNSSVFIIPDSGLNSLNFETLKPQPDRYWVEDMTLSDAPSLRLLPASRNSEKLSGKLLLLGDPSPASSGTEDSYPQLPNAAAQMQNITNYFPARQREAFSGQSASPAAYLQSHPEDFSYIHFVAHGTASRMNPLDSAIILSPGRPNGDSANSGTTENAAQNDDSFKLYARDIINTPRLRAQLVTISACYSTGKRTYSGEGLVGVSWAFLRAGAHNVVAALWDVSDASAPQLIDEFYAGLKKGESPAAALRSAKLSLLHGSTFRSPFYWAAFQLYTGS